MSPESARTPRRMTPTCIMESNESAAEDPPLQRLPAPRSCARANAPTVLLAVAALVAAALAFGGAAETLRGPNEKPSGDAVSIDHVTLEAVPHEEMGANGTPSLNGTEAVRESGANGTRALNVTEAEDNGEEGERSEPDYPDARDQCGGPSSCEWASKDGACKGKGDGSDCWSICCDYAHFGMPNLFGSYMVLPAGNSVPLWGWARPEVGSVYVQVDEESYNAKVDWNSGRWDLTLPARDATMKPIDILIKAGKATKVLRDVLVGELYMCVGASNIAFKVEEASDSERELNATVNYSDRLRIVGVGHSRLTAPQEDFVPKFPWQRPQPDENTGMFSALCYFFGLEQLKVRPDIPVGLIGAGWGATSAYQWAPPQAFDACGIKKFEDAGTGHFYEPEASSVLWYSMMHPFTAFALKGIVVNIQGNSCILPAMVRAWQHGWEEKHHGPPAVLVAQFGCNTGVSGETADITESRNTQMTYLQAPRTGLAVTSDLCDPASPHAIMHSPFKREEARRVAILGESIIHENGSIPPKFPRPVAAHVDKWDASWGTYHYGTEIQEGDCAGCVWGIRVVFDQDVTLRPEFQDFTHFMGHINGFTLYPHKSVGARNPITLSMTEVQGNTVFLNATVKGEDYVGSPWPGTLIYGFGGFPILSLVNTVGEPVGQFQVTVPF